MLIQILLILTFTGVLVFSYQQRAYSRLVSFILILAAISGIIFAAVPHLSTYIAQGLGIGRGVDLGLYLYVPISLLLILHLNAKLRRTHVDTTELVRELALLRQKLEQPSK